MAPHPPNPLPREVDSASIQNIINHALSLNDPVNLPILQNRQNQQPPATVTVTAAPSPTQTLITATVTPSSNDDNPATKTTTLSGGAIAGIVIGGIVALLLLIWIFRSCSNLGAPPTDQPPNGRAWYDGVRSEYPPPPPRSPHRHRSRSHHSHAGHHHHHHHRRSGSVGVAEVREVHPVAVVRKESRRRTSKSPYREHGYDDRVEYPGSWEDDRGRRERRSRSRGRGYEY